MYGMLCCFCFAQAGTIGMGNALREVRVDASVEVEVAVDDDAPVDDDPSVEVEALLRETDDAGCLSLSSLKDGGKWHSLSGEGMNDCVEFVRETGDAGDGIGQSGEDAKEFPGEVVKEVPGKGVRDDPMGEFWGTTSPRGGEISGRGGGILALRP